MTSLLAEIGLESLAVAALTVFIGIGAGLLGHWLFVLRGQKRAAELSRLGLEREARMFQQNELINELGADKIRAEARLAELQCKLADLEIERRQLDAEFQKLALAKMRLDIDHVQLQTRLLRRELGGHDDL